MNRATTLLALFALTATLAACGGGAPNNISDPTDTTSVDPPIPTTPPPQGLRTATTHAMQYRITLPPNWSSSRRWPVAINITGVDRDWASNHADFVRERNAKNYPFIIVTPSTFTNGGGNPAVLRAASPYYSAAVLDQIERDGRCPFDLQGLAAVISDVYKLYGGQSKALITGFSSGGNTSAALLALRPELLRGVAQAAGNWGGRCVTGWAESPLDDRVPHPISTAPERVNLAVRFFNGTNDGAAQFLIPQRDSLTNLLRRSGYQNVSSTMVQGAGHEAMPSQVLAHFYSLLAANER